MANPAPKMINYNFSYLIVSVRGPSQTCASLSVSLCLCVRVSVCPCVRVSVCLCVWMLTCGYRDGHCTRFLWLPHSASGHIMVTNLPSCALTVLWSSVEFGDLLLGSSKTFVRESSSNTVSLCLCVSVSLCLVCVVCLVCVCVCLCVRVSVCLSIFVSLCLGMGMGMCMCMCMCFVFVYVYVCVCGGGGGGGQSQEKLLWRLQEILTRKSFVIFFNGSERQIEPSHGWFPPTFPQDNWSLTALLGKANDWRNREHVVLDLFSNLNMGKI